MSTILYNLLENSRSKYFLKINFLIYTFIIINLIATSLETVVEIRIKHSEILEGIEHFTMFIFSIEYISRLIAAKHTAIYRKGGWLAYLFSTTHLIDFIALIPYYVSFFGFNSSDFI